MPVIPATQEAKAGESQVRGQLRQMYLNLSQKQNKNKRSRDI
jgi:hypothetical protein